MSTPSSLDVLIEALRCLPGVGPKSAQRMAFHLLQRDQRGAARLATALGHAGEAPVQFLHQGAVVGGVVDEVL